MEPAGTGTQPVLRAASPAEVEAELRKILASRRFEKSDALRTFLRFISERTLQGRGDELKEAVVAIDAFQRGASFDPRLDAFVRVQAGRLRAAPFEYYETEGKDDPVEIKVSKGSYTPVFSLRPAALPARQALARARSWRMWAVSLFAVAFIFVAFLWLFHSRVAKRSANKSPSLTQEDSIVVAGFENTTGDPVFDDTIRQALLMDLDQSPFLNILPESTVLDTRHLMARPLSEPFTLEVAREVCQRAGGKVVLSGSIASMGRLYVIGMTVTNYATGEAFIRDQVRAEGKEHVLQALDDAASDLRSKLGESFANVQKYSVPLERVTTPSLKAL